MSPRIWMTVHGELHLHSTRIGGILLVGGDKSGGSQDKFYRNLIEIAERRFDQHRRALASEKEK